MIRRGGRRNSLAQSYEAVNWRRADGTMGMRNARILLSAREFLPLLRPLGRRTVGHFFRRLFHLCPPLKSSAAYYITECRAIHFNPFSRPIFSACPRSFPSSLSLILSHSTRKEILFEDEHAWEKERRVPYLLALSIKSGRGLVQ